MLFDDCGIVLAERNVGDYDKLLTLLLKNHGKIIVSAKGARSKKSKISASSCVLTYSDFTIYDTKGRYTIRAAQTKEAFFGLSGEVAKLALGMYFSDTASAMTDEGCECEDILRLLLNSLFALQSLDKPILLIKAAYELKLMELSGYMPDLSCCSVCGGHEGLSLSYQSGCLLCGKCGGEHPLSEGVLRAMRFVLDADLKRIFSFSLDFDALVDFNYITERFLREHADKSFKTLDFFKSVV